MARILAVAAHLDDEVLGCGGTLSRHAARGDQVFVCVLTDSSSTQYAGQPEKLERKKREGEAAASILGVAQTFLLDFPDMKLDTVPHHRINDAVSEVVSKVSPDVVYTHFWGDLNLDHVIAFRCTMVATRPVTGWRSAVYAYEVLSSTEWAMPQTPFVPNTYGDISDFLNTKLLAMECYGTELREYPHPRSLEAIEHLAKKRGSEVSLLAAEAFMLVRQVW